MLLDMTDTCNNPLLRGTRVARLVASQPLLAMPATQTTKYQTTPELQKSTSHHRATLQTRGELRMERIIRQDDVSSIINRRNPPTRKLHTTLHHSYRKTSLILRRDLFHQTHKRNHLNENLKALLGITSRRRKAKDTFFLRIQSRR